MGRNSRGRAQEAQWKLMLQGSQYADRLPIGLESVIKNVSADTVRAFYDRWCAAQERLCPRVYLVFLHSYTWDDGDSGC
jgi:predicted Zn-dependent peptidase